MALTSVMSKSYVTVVVSRLERQKELEGWNKLHVGGVARIGCQHFRLCR